MLNTTNFRTVSRRSVQLAVLATVAAVGVSVGRWVAPEDSGIAPSSAPNAVLGAEQAPVSQDPALHSPISKGGSLMERKLDRMDAEDARLLGESPPPQAGSLMERKLAQMDAQDASVWGDAATDPGCVFQSICGN
ncbi:MAG TPA: hypothetical protein VLS25_07885 [Dehalococcoidia bacterium]|nr:hypothetical protein [Dehalococcoidia bacterium]